MRHQYFHQFITGVVFGVTSGVITALGVLAGLYSATASKLAVVSGIIVMAIADGLADASGLRLSEEAEMDHDGYSKHDPKEATLTGVFTFLAVASSILTFAVPILLLPLETAILVASLWGLLLLTASNFYVAKLRGDGLMKFVVSRLLLAVGVVLFSYWLGALIPKFL